LRGLGNLQRLGRRVLSHSRRGSHLRLRSLHGASDSNPKQVDSSRVLRRTIIPSMSTVDSSRNPLPHPPFYTTNSRFDIESHGFPQVSSKVLYDTYHQVTSGMFATGHTFMHLQNVWTRQTMVNHQNEKHKRALG